MSDDNRQKSPAEILAIEKRRRRKRVVPKDRVYECHLFEARVSLNLTLREVAAALKMSLNSIHLIEQGSNLKLNTALKIARFYGKTVDELWKLVD